MSDVFSGGQLGTPPTAGQPTTATADTGQGANQPNKTQQTSTESTPQTQGQGVAADWTSQYGTPDKMFAELQQVKQAYDKLRPKFTQVTQELSTLKKSNTQQQTPEATQPQGHSNDAVRMLQEIVDARVREVIAPLREKQEETSMAAEVEALRRTNGRIFDEVMPIAKQILTNEPSLWGTKEPVKAAFMIAKAEYLEKNIQTIVGNEASGAVEAAKQKLALAGHTAQVGQKPAPEKTEADKVAESIANFGKRGGSIFG